MATKPKRRAVKSQLRSAHSRLAKVERPVSRKAVRVDTFVLSAFIEALQQKGYTKAQARLRAKELLASPGFSGFPPSDAADDH